MEGVEDNTKMLSYLTPQSLEGIAYPTIHQPSRRPVCMLPVTYFLAGRRRVQSRFRTMLLFETIRAWQSLLSTGINLLFIEKA
jgi:hypothetical protein